LEAAAAKSPTVAKLTALAEAGKLDLNQPIAKYAPRVTPCLGRVTMHQLLSHTAGMRDEAAMDGPHDDAALERTVLGWKDDVCMANAGRVFSYSNLGYGVAGYVMEQVTAKPFADIVRDLVLTPTGMRTSTYRPLQAMTFPLALGHHPRDKIVRPFADHSGTWPAGSLFSSVNEMARFAIALMDGGKIGGEQALPAAVVARITSAKTPISAMDREYGYGLELSTEDGLPAIRHTGGRIGYGSVVHLLPSRRVGVIVLVNSTSLPNRLARKVAQLAAGVTPERGSAQPESTSVADRVAARIAGTYVNSAAIRTTLEIRDGQLQLQFAGRWFPVRQLGPDRFGAKGAAQLQDFRILDGANGNPEFLVAEMWALRRR
ncbi:MAG: serine hydrolase domain-containing protein, partial [Bryobacteraceae bacterium]